MQENFQIVKYLEVASTHSYRAGAINMECM